MKIKNFHTKEIVNFLKPENQRVFLELNLRNKIPDDYQKLNKFLKFERETRTNLIK